MTETHAKYSPSKLPRIILCPGSIQETQDYPPEEESSYANEGTMLHLATSNHLDNNEFTVLQSSVESFNLDQPQVDAVQECLDYVFNLHQLYEGEEFYTQAETQVSLSPAAEEYHCPELEDVYGTLDYAIVIPSLHTLHIVDWKFGSGIEVFPDSAQLKAYALGKALKMKWMKPEDKVFLTIVQPRLYSGELVKTHETTKAELLSWLKDELVPALRLINAKHPPLRPSKMACQWCSAKTTCSARRKQNLATALEVFQVHAQLPDPIEEDLLHLLAKAGDLKQFLSDIETWVFRNIQKGRQVEGWKLVQGRSIRKWGKPEKEVKQYVAKFVGDPETLYTKKFVSPAQAEKLVGAKIKKDKEFQDLIVKPEGKPTLVPEADKRPAISYRTAAEIFSDEPLL